MFKKRYRRLKRLAEEMEKLRGNAGSGDSQPSEKPRRVPNAAFFSRIAAMKIKGGAGETPKG